MYTSKLHTSLLITLELLHSLHEILGFVLLVGQSASTPFYSRAEPGDRLAVVWRQPKPPPPKLQPVRNHYGLATVASNTVIILRFTIDSLSGV